MATVAILGRGQLGLGVSRLLRANDNLHVLGPFSRNDRIKSLTSGADVVVIATTTRFRDVAADIETALRAGSNVLVSAEECAYPRATDLDLASKLGALAVQQGVSVAGCGVNPGLIFDALVLTVLGAAPRDCTIKVDRAVDIGKFGSETLRRIGIGYTREAFNAAVSEDRILGHAGFPQSMWVVASAVGRTIERIRKELHPLSTDVEIDLPGRFVVKPGESAGVDQTYAAIVDGERWYTARFYGHVNPEQVNMIAADQIQLYRDGELYQQFRIQPGIGAQVGSQNMVANSICRIMRAPPGWLTVADLAPAFPSQAAR